MSLFSLENEAKINGSQVTLARLNKLIDLDLKVRNAFVWTEQFIFRIEFFFAIGFYSDFLFPQQVVDRFFNSSRT